MSKQSVSRWPRMLVALSTVFVSVVISITTQSVNAQGSIWEAKINGAMGLSCRGGNSRFMAGSSPSGVDITGWSITGGSDGDRTRTVTFPGGDTLKVINDCHAGESLRFRNTFGNNTMKVDGVVSSWTIGVSGDWDGIEYYDLPVGSSISITFSQAGQWGSLQYMYYDPNPSQTRITPGTTPGEVSYPVVGNPTDYLFESTAPPAPTVTTLNPTSGAAAGGTVITITGTNFVNGATVTVGGAACTNVTVVNATEITCTTPAGTAGSASVVVTVNGSSNGANSLFTYEAPPTTTTTTVAPTTTTVAVANNSAAPTLVTSTNQAALTAAPGSASVLVNGVAVTPQIVTASNSVAAQTDPAERTPQQVRELQQVAATIETRLDTIAGGDSGVSVVRTETGAVMTGIFSGTRVPVEDVVVVNAADTATLFAARDVRGNIVEVKPGAILEVASNGDVAVQAFGLQPGEAVELVVMSTPTLLGNFTVDSKGTIKTTAKLPASIGTGNHSLVVASPSVKASLGLKLVKSTGALPETGSTTTDLSNWAVAVLLSGVYVMMAARSRRRSWM